MSNKPQTKSTEEGSPILKPIMWTIIFIALGILMIAFPDMMTGQVASGRRAGIKQLLIMIWGIPGGIFSLLLGGFNIFLIFNHLQDKK